MTRILCVAAEKGGVGKTTTVMSLAAVLAEGGRTLVVDVDPQASCVWWAERAGEQLPFEFADSTDPAILAHLRDASAFDTVLVDTPGSLRDTAVLAAVLDQADYVILPAEAAPLSVPPTQRTVERLIRPRGLPFKVLLSKVDGRHTQDAADMRRLLAAKEMPVFATGVRRYVAHERAPLAGVVVTQYEESLATRNAIDDYRRVAVEVMTDLSRIPQAVLR